MSGADEPVRFRKVHTRKELLRQFERAEKAVKAGKAICLTDLIANAEKIHLKQMRKEMES